MTVVAAPAPEQERKGGKGGKKGEKGGKKGGKKGDKGGKKGGGKGGEYGPRKPRHFRVDEELEKDTRPIDDMKAELAKVTEKVEAKKAVVAGLKDAPKECSAEEQKEKEAQIKESIAEQKVLQAAAEEKLREVEDRRDEVKGEKMGLQNQKVALLDEMKAKRSLLGKELGVKTAITEERLEEAIRQAEDEHESCSNLSKTAEQRFMKQLKMLRSLRGPVKEIGVYKELADAKEAQVKVLNEKINEQEGDVKTEREAVRAITQEIRTLKMQLDRARDGNDRELKIAEQDLEKVQKQSRTVEFQLKYKQAKKRSEEEWVQYEEDEKKWKEDQEKRREKAEAERLRTDVDYRERKERQAARAAERAEQDAEIAEIKKQDPWRDERLLCANLIEYLEKALGKTAAAKTEEKTAQQKMDEAMAKMKERAGDKFKVLKKEEEEDTYKFKKTEKAVAAKVPAGSKRAAAAAAEKKEKADEPIKHPLDKFDAFDRMKVDTPMTVSQSQACLDVLVKRKEWILSAGAEDTMQDLRTKVAKKPAANGAADKPKNKGGKGGKGGKRN